MSKLNQKIAEESNFERVKIIGDEVKKKQIEQKIKEGELRWAFCGIDNDKLYQYYTKVKKINK